MSACKDFIVKPGAKMHLRAIDPDFTGKHDRDSAKEATEANIARLRELQELLYAEHKRSLLICLQAMDAGGKDGVIRHVLGMMNPQGCKVYSFKQPAGIEREHDYLWRCVRELPAKGEIGIFNRSYYEDVLVPCVHKLVPAEVVQQRYTQINTFEKHLAQNNTHVLKFFLHIDKEEQLARFKDRLDDSTKRWKISEADYSERNYWNEYGKAFEAMLSRCSSKEAPWFVIPANRKWFRDLAVSEILVEYLESLKMRSPAPAVNLTAIRRKYHAERGKR